MNEASFLAVDAGIDMHMHGPKFVEAVIKAVNDGGISEERIDESCRKILAAKFKLGLFENRFVDLDKIKDRINTKEHQQTALETA